MVVVLVLAPATDACTGASPSLTSVIDAGPKDGASASPTFGGSGNLDPLGPMDASSGVRVAILFGTTCAGGPETSCHGSHAGNLWLRLGPDGGDVVDVPASEEPTLRRVVPGDPTHSYLYLKVQADGGVDGGRMPLGAPYDPRIDALIRAWIDEGAGF